MLNFLLQWPAFEDIFCTGGGEFDQSNFKKFKFPGSARGGGHVEVSNTLHYFTICSPA
jgi:hypothetical protein